MSRDRKITYILTIIIGISFLASIFVLSGRYKNEESFKNVEIILSIQDLETLASANNKDLEDVLKDFKNSGATSIIVREKSLGDLERDGDLTLIKNSKGILLEINNATFSEQVKESVLTKKMGRIINLDGRELIEIPMKMAASYALDEGYKKVLDETGIGFDNVIIDKINKSGMMLIPQIRSWKNYNQESIDLLAENISKMENISILLSNDSSVAGFPGYVDEILDGINPERNIPVGMVEFFKQTGLGSVVLENDLNAVRIHSISDKEMLNFSEKKAIDRYMLSVEERNIRGVFLKLFYLENPMNTYEININYVNKMSDSLKDSGFNLGQASLVHNDKAKNSLYFLIIPGLFAGIGMIFHKLKNPILGSLGFFGTGLLILGLFIINSTLALKIAALLFVLVYPVLAFISVVHYEEVGRKNTILEALKNTISISVITFAGALMMSSLLSSTPFMITLDQFSGVKMAHIIPLLVIPFILIFWNKEGFTNIKNLMNMAIQYKVAIIGVIGAGALGYYLLRTGNQGAGLVPGFEEKLRESLNHYLGVRPRTKEFFIGYPSLMLLMYLGVNKRTWPLLFPAIIGQVSLINTYAHLHTPIVISLQRSSLGLIIGLFLGLLLIIAWRIMEKIYEKYIS